MSSQVISTDNATIFIEIKERKEKKGQHHNEHLKGFLKVQAKALGVMCFLVYYWIIFKSLCSLD